MLCFVKKLTVIGIIGKIQGINSAANPPKKAKKKIVHKLFSSLSAGFSMFVSFTGATVCFVVSVSAVATESVGLETVSVTSVVAVSVTFKTGKVNFKLEVVCTHLPSIHACPSAKTSIVFNFGFIIFTRWVNLAIPEK